jgi:hypothetical protein
VDDLLAAARRHGFPISYDDLVECVETNDKRRFAFDARCVEEREVSPLSVGDEVEVVGMPAERECEREMYVSIAWGERTLAVPLAQLEVVDASDQTREAVEDWTYWVAMGYDF